MTDNCPFDNPDPERTFFGNELIFCLWDGFAVSDGHALVITRRHVASWFETTDAERRALLEGIEVARREIQAIHTPDGFNIGINVHEAAGQTIDHVHVHVIPRYTGDVPDPRGGVRYVIPEKANYLVKDGQPQSFSENLSTGPRKPLLPMLQRDFDAAQQVDIAVAFTLESGVSLLQPYMRDLLRRDGTQLRFLTGDYLDATHPAALRQLLDLPGEREIKVFETAQGMSFHPKAYIFRFPDGDGRAYVGSSNVSKSALVDGVEWNYRIISSAAQSDFAAICTEFERLYSDKRSAKIDDAWIDKYEERRPEAPVTNPIALVEVIPGAPKPHEVQLEALDALSKSRASGNAAGLVVLATGLGKTWLSAFDTAAAGAKRVLFVAHREEILDQALSTFRRIRPSAKLGRFTGKEKAPNAEILFASIQTLGRMPHLRTFERDAFDYIIVDEFHHAAARTYRNLIDYFDCGFLLGLTATPERTDGGDLLALCGQNLVYRCDLFEGINLGLLSPFHYFGVPDNIDYTNITWRSSRFDPTELDNAVATKARAQNAFEQWQERAGERTLAFCCSQKHAEFTAEYFRSKNVNAVAVHSGEKSAPRTSSLEALQCGDIDMLCAVDMFNEGVDVPNIDTVLMLRPTESAILWTQQVGRGLRRSADKKHLTVIDYIGNHRIFLTKPRSLLGLDASDSDIRLALARIREGAFELPAGCEVTYELEAVEILESLLRNPPKGTEVVEAYYADYKQRMGERPTALEAFHDGYNPRLTSSKNWLDFVRQQGDLAGSRAEVYQAHTNFLNALESTPMTKSFKMLVLLGMLNEDCFPGQIAIDRLVSSVRRIVGRSPLLREEFGPALDDDEAFRSSLERNPIKAWAGGAATGKTTYFKYEGETFASTLDCADAQRAALQELTRELADWRLADYQQRQSATAGDGEFICKVFHSSGQPIIKLPERTSNPRLPMGWRTVRTNDGDIEANFVKIAINVARKPGESTNILPQLLRSWFGPDAGLPGTGFRVKFAAEGDQLRMSPQNPIATKTGAQLWKSYSREQIPGLFGFEFSTGAWNQGFIAKPGHLFLLVTLDKGGLVVGNQYVDHFESPTQFAWQSQERTTQSSKHGKLIRNHQVDKNKVHLFVRKTKKIKNRAAPFIYCGEVLFSDWDGEKPISVVWQLKQELPIEIFRRLRESVTNSV